MSGFSVALAPVKADLQGQIDALDADAFGVGQTLSRPARSNGDIVQNVSGKVIFVEVFGYNPKLQVGAVSGTWDFTFNSGGNDFGQAVGVVPDGFYYKVSAGGTMNRVQEFS